MAAKRLGFRVVLDVEETGSGARNDRPGLTRVLEAAHRGRLSAVLVWKLDRAGRSARDLLANVREIVDLDSGLIRHHPIYWGWRGVQVLQRDEYHH